MNKKVLVMGVVLAVIALPSFAAIEYEFTQKLTSDDGVLPSTDLIGRTVIDGLRTRVDFRGGTLYPPGTYAVTTDSRLVYFVDPANKSYTEVNMAGAATALAAGNIKIENFTSNIERLTDRPVMAGLDTDHYRITIDYDITVRMGNLPLKRHVNTVIESWTTARYGEMAQDFITGGSTFTGNVEVDKLLNSVKVPGFPLRQIITTRTHHDLPQTKSSKLEVAPTRTSVRELWVTSIRETRGEGISFTVPAAYARADVPDAPRAATKVLTFEPNGK